MSAHRSLGTVSRRPPCIAMKSRVAFGSRFPNGQESLWRFRRIEGVRFGRMNTCEVRESLHLICSSAQGGACLMEVGALARGAGPAQRSRCTALSST